MVPSFSALANQYSGFSFLFSFGPQAPCGDGAMRHFGVPSAFITGIPGFTMSAVKAVYQNICWAIAPCAGTGPDSEKVMPCACGGAYFFIHSRYLPIE